MRQFTSYRFLKTTFSFVATSVLCLAVSSPSQALKESPTLGSQPAPSITQDQLHPQNQTELPSPQSKSIIKTTEAKRTQFSVPNTQKIAGYYTYYCTYGYYWNGYYWVWACL